MQMSICIAVFIFMVISFCLNRIPMALTAVLGMLALVVTGCIDSRTVLSTIGSSTVLTMLSVFIVAAGLQRTQMIERLSRGIYRVSKGSFTKVLASYVLFTFILGQFIPSITALFAIVCPLVYAMCDEMDISPSRMMYSIGLVAVATSFTITPIGPYAAAYIEDNGYILQYGIEGYELTMFTRMSIKTWVSLFVILWAIFVSPRLAPAEPVVPIRMMERRRGDEKRPLEPFQEFMGYAVFIAVIISLVFKSFGLASWVIPACGAAVLVLCGVLTQKEAIESMGIEVIMLYVGVAVLGSAFANTGAGEMIGKAVGGVLSGTRSSYLIGSIFFAASFLMTSLLYNRATTKVLIPLVLLTALDLGCDPRGLMEMCYIGSMCSLLTPMATSVVPMMMGAGGYDQKVLVKLGLIPSVIMGVIAVAVGMTLYPCF